MPRKPAQLTVEVKIGAVANLCLDVLNTSAEAMELIPEWCEQDRQRIEVRLTRLLDAVQLNMKAAK